ncbi:prepilin-type N-terminal cleavage/methylation domain-containing protein [bacterium]|nr:MAG: prepilin-type N-terminal cleavage/methylation domain-containing protein [bacterium]
MAAGYAILNFMPHHPVSRAKGFTLIELIAVIAIVAVVSGMSLASFSTLTGDRLTANARKIVSDLCWARQLAAAKHRNHIVVFDTAAESYVIYDDLDADASADPSEEIKEQILTTGIDLVSVTPPTAQLTFGFPLGTTQTKTITLSSQGKIRAVVTFANTGYVRIQ